MKKKFFPIIIIPALLVLGFISGCYYDAVIPDVSIYSEAETSFDGDIIPIFNTSCSFTECHSPGDETPDLSAANAYDALINGNYINLQNPELSELYQWVKGNRASTMPINGTDPKIVSAVLSWIKQGGQNN